MVMRTKGEKIFAVFNYVFLAALGLATLYPFIYTLSMSLSTTAEAARAGLHLYPKEISLMSYKMVFNNKEIIGAYRNTIFRTVFGVGLTLLITSMFSYALSRSYMPLKRLFTFYTVFTMMFTGGLIPTYLLIKNLGLIDNRLVYILPGMVTAYNVIIMKNFFNSIPDSLAESAKIDGANEIIILFKIFIPLSKPVMATIALWAAVHHWNAWFDAMLYINTNTKLVVQIILRRIVLENNFELIQKGIVDPNFMSFTPETVKSATIIVTILPILCVYPFIQKYFTKGVMLGSVKG